MADARKRLTARFYKTAAGTEPVRAWILDLPPADRRIIGIDIATVEFGWPVGMPTCKPLGDDLWEVRSKLTGRRIGRIIFCIEDDRMVLLHGFEKTTRKTPLADLRLATQRKKDLRS